MRQLHNGSCLRSIVAPKHGTLHSLLRPRFNLIGLVGVEAGINYTFALTLQATIQLARPDVVFTPAALFGLYAGVTIVHAIVNTVSAHEADLLTELMR